MIYLENYKYTQRVIIPNGFPKIGGMFTLVLISTVTNKESRWESLENMSISDRYYAFDIALGENFAEGEYEYQVVGDNEILSVGLAVVKHEKIEYKEYDERTEYKEYEED